MQLVNEVSHQRRSRAPRIDRHGEVVYLIDVDDKRWRIYDVSRNTNDGTGERVMIHQLGSIAATERVFISPVPGGPRLSYVFASHDSRDVTLAVTSRQLVAARAFRPRQTNTFIAKWHIEPSPTTRA